MATSRNLADFAKRMSIRAAQIKDNTTRLVRHAAHEVNRVLVETTPVDTGFAASGYFQSIGNPSDEIPAEGGSPNDSLTRAPTVIDSWVEGMPPIYITNSVEYITLLDNGYSQQAPRGMSAQAILTGNQILKTGKLLNG